MTREQADRLMREGKIHNWSADETGAVVIKKSMGPDTGAQGNYEERKGG